jgi:hypothetical protein
MGDVHKFKRPPKNEKQFRGYRPQSPKPGSQNPSRRQLRDWQRSAIAWSVLVLLAIGIWAIRSTIGST